jgi:hypothetical protein
MAIPPNIAVDPAISTPAAGMSGWLKFIGVINILIGIPNMIILVGFLYIWLGVLLYQAGDAASTAGAQDVPRLLNKLKTYFIINGVLMLLGLLVFILFFAVVGVGFFYGVFESAMDSATRV